MSSRGGASTARASRAGGKTPQEKLSTLRAREAALQQRLNALHAEQDNETRLRMEALGLQREGGHTVRTHNYANADEANRHTVNAQNLILPIMDAERQLKSIQTQIRNTEKVAAGTLKSDARSRTYERQIAQHEAQAAKHASEAARLRAEYEEYRRTGNAPAAGTRAGTRPPLVPVGHVDPKLLGPDHPLDPYVLQQLYGSNQIRQALEGRALTALQQAATITHERNPGTSPRSRSQKKALIDYIVSHVAGEGY